MNGVEAKRVSLDLRFLSRSGMGSATYHHALWEGLHDVAPAHFAWWCHGLPPDSERMREATDPDRPTRNYRRRRDESGADGAGRWTYLPGPALSANLWNLAWLPWRLERLDPDLHHATLNFQAPLYLSCPLVVTLLDLIPLTHPSFVTRRYSLLFRTLLGPVLRRASRVIVLSRHGELEARKLFPIVGDKLRIVSCGLSRRSFIPPAEGAATQTRARLGVPGEYLLFIGPAEPRKNLAVLLRALLRLAAEGREVPELVTVGTTPRSNSELDALRHRAQPFHRDCGRVSGNDLCALISASRGVLFPTLAEGFGYPPLEAMAQGVPAAVSDLPVLREVMGDGALFLDPHDSGAWAEAMRFLATPSPERRALTRRGQEISRGFTARRLGEETLRVYADLL